MCSYVKDTRFVIYRSIITAPLQQSYTNVIETNFFLEIFQHLYLSAVCQTTKKNSGIKYLCRAVVIKLFA